MLGASIGTTYSRGSTLRSFELTDLGLRKAQSKSFISPPSTSRTSTDLNLILTLTLLFSRYQSQSLSYTLSTVRASRLSTPLFRTRIDIISTQPHYSFRPERGAPKNKGVSTLTPLRCSATYPRNCKSYEKVYLKLQEHLDIVVCRRYWIGN